jgi:nitrite reductase (NAD(P)H)
MLTRQDEHRPAIETMQERGQKRAADWPKQFPPEKFEVANLATPKEQWKWVPLATVDDLMPTDQNTTSAAVRYGDDSQLAIFHVPGRGYYATQQMCPHKRAFVLDHGIVGDDKDGNLYVSCP